MFKHTTFVILSLFAAAFSFAQKDAPNSRLANSIAAIAEDKIITVEDVRRKLQPYLPELQKKAEGDPMKFRKLIEEFENQIIQEMTDNVLIVKKFYEDKGQIPPSFVDNEIEETIITQFDGKRANYLNYLQSIGKTPEEHRQEVKEDIIVNYMRSKMRKSASVVSPVKIEDFYTEHKDQFYQEEAIHLRLIRLTQVADEDADVLDQTAQEILKKLDQGYAFDELAMKYSNDAKAKKGGDWGWVSRGSLVEKLGEVAFSLKPGEHSEPLPLGKNLFILFVEEHRPAGYLPLQDVRSDIEDMLISQMAHEAEDRFLERLRRDGYVRRFN